MREAKVAAYRHKRPVRVFLSHSYADLVLARKIRNVLAQHLSLSVFLHEDLSAGEDWQSKLRKELEGADVFVALLTPYSVADNWVLSETGAAWALEKPIIPIVTRRDVLNNLPMALDPQMTLELKEDQRDLDKPGIAGKFVQAFENTLALSHVSTA